MPLTLELAAPSREQQTAGTAEMLARREPGTVVPHGSASPHTQPVAGDPMPGTSSSHETPRHTTHNALVHRDSTLGVADPGAGATPISPGVSAAIAAGVVLFVLVLAAFGLRNTGKSWKGRNGSNSDTDEEAAREQQQQQQHGRGGKDGDADARRHHSTTHPAPRPTTRMQTPPYVEQQPPPVSQPEPAAHRRPRLARNTSPFTAEMRERRQAPQQRRGREAAGLHVAVGAGTVGDHGPELRHPTPISPVGVSGGDMSALLGTAGGGGGRPILPPVLTPGWCPTPTPPPPAGAGGARPSSSAVGVQQGQISHDIAPFQAQGDVPSGGQQLRERERERLEELMRRQGEVRAAAGREGQ